jgi:hypothetical protein
MEAELKPKFDRIADQIVRNKEEINNILSNCSVESKLISVEFQKKIEEIFNSNTSDIIQNKASDEYYDTETIDTIFKYLDSGKPAQQSRLFRSESQLSISSTMSLQTTESTSSSNQENIKEFMRQLSEAKGILESISNSPLNVPDLTTIAAGVTEQKSHFIELVFSLRRLMKELTSIAATDKIEKEVSLPGKVDDDFLSSLQHLNEVRKKTILIALY